MKIWLVKCSDYLEYGGPDYTTAIYTNEESAKQCAEFYTEYEKNQGHGDYSYYVVDGELEDEFISFTIEDYEDED